MNRLVGERSICHYLEPNLFLSSPPKRENINIFIKSLLEFWSCLIVTNGNSWYTSIAANCNNNVIKILQHIVKATFGQISSIKYFKKQAFVWSVFNCIHDFLTRNAWNEHSIHKKPVILPDLSFLEMQLSNHVRGASNFNQISWWALFFPEKKANKVRRKEL